ncbi:hypothetical protein ACFL3S_02145 [Gemmatimonadota bacterium]
MKARIHYEERSGWTWWVHLAVWSCSIAAVFPIVELSRGNVGGGEGAMSVWYAAWLLLLGLGLPLTIYTLMGQLRARVNSEGVEVAWGLAELVRKRIPFEEVEEVEAVTYSPLGEFGGWGIRMGGHKKKAWNIRGNRAVLLHLTDGTRFYLGSDRPERMVEWIRSQGKGKIVDPGSEGGDSGQSQKREE